MPLKRKRKGKGSQFERHVCKLLSEWWTNGESDSVFWRTSQSGGRATSRRKKGKNTVNQSGDICAIDPIGQPFLDCFAVEIKRGYPTVTIHDLLDTKKPIYAKWIEQAEASREASGAEWWMIIHQRDRREALVSMSYLGIANLGKGWPDNLLHVSTKDTDASTCTMKDFLECACPKYLTKLAEARKQR